MTKSNQAPSKGRLTLGGIVTLVIAIIIFIAQNAMDEGNDETTTPVPNTPVSSPVVSGDETTTTGDVKALANGGIDGGWYQVYFTTPINTTDESKFTGAQIENALVTALNGASTSIDAALFELNSEPVTQALIAAQERGVQVRVVTDGEHGMEDPESTVEELEMAGIEVVSDGTRGGLMHDKFFVIDNLYVWTGSTNITHNGMYNNNNNSILFRSSQLAANYALEFEELFSGQFGKTSPKDIPNPVITVNNTQIETFFESEGNAPERLAELIADAKTIHFMTFSFTGSLTWEDASGEHALTDLIYERVQSGELEMWGIVEASSRKYLKEFFCAELNMHQDGNPDILHHKLFIIDRSIVVMGSFNFSNSAANDNDENLLIIQNPDIAKAYLDEFDRRWAESEVPSRSDMDC